MQARYYDPVLGRFLSNDPVAFSVDRPQYFNRYAYALNDPVNMIDPDGQQSKAAIEAQVARTLNKGRQPSAMDRALTNAALHFTPVIGDIKGVGEAFANPTAANIAGAVVGVVPVVGDAGGAIIKGTAQATKKAGQATTHASTSERIAGEMAASGEFTSVHMNQTVNTITDGAVN